MKGEQSNWQKIVDHWTLSEHEYKIGDSEQSSSCREIQDLKEVRLHSNNDDQKMEALLFQQEREGNTRRRARRFLTPWPRMILSSWRKTLGMMSKRSKSGTGQSARVNQSHSLTNSDFVISLPDTAAAIVTVAIRILQTIKMPFKIAWKKPTCKKFALLSNWLEFKLFLH